MDLPPGWHLSIEDRPPPAARNRLGREVGKHNRPYLRNAKWQSLGVFVREPDGDIAAGLAGSTYGDWFIHCLIVPNGCSTVSRRWSRMSGRCAMRACIRSNTASFSRRDTERN